MDILSKSIPKKSALSLYVALTPLVFLIGTFFYVLTGSLIPVMCSFLIAYGVTVIFTIAYFGGLSIYAIFLYTSAFFIYDCFVFTIFSDKNFLIQHFPKNYAFDAEVGFTFLVASFLCIYTMHITYCFVKKRKVRKFCTEAKTIAIQKIGKGLMFIAIVPVFTKLIIQIKYVVANGYLSIFTGALAELRYPFWTTGAFSIFNTGYYLFLAGNPTRKGFFRWSVLFFAVAISISLKGQRGPVLAVLVFLAYWYTKKYEIKIKPRYILYLAVFILFVVIGMGQIRNGYGSKKKINSKLQTLTLASDALYSQTNSKAVPMLVIRGDLKWHRYPFIFSPIMYRVNTLLHPTAGQTEDYLQYYNDISSVTMANISKSAYARGSGYGGAFLAESYDCGKFIGVIGWSLLLALFMAFCDFSDLKLSAKLIVIIAFILKDIATLPRGRMFGFMSDVQVPLLCYLLMALAPTVKCIKSK